MAKGILVVIQFETNVGYAIAPLERTFFEMALAMTGSVSRVFFAYKDVAKGAPRSLPREFTNFTAFDTYANTADEFKRITSYIAEHKIDTVFGFDLPVHLQCYTALRRAGIETIVAYWGAPMSGINHGVKLLLKRLDVMRRRSGPDHYIFESEAMRKLAVQGRGIARNRTSVIRLGVDTERFQPTQSSSYVHKVFSIPPDRKVIFYSGHMQERKGVHVIVAAAAELVNIRRRTDLHFLFTGNRPGEEQRFDTLYKGSLAADYITFGGYRDDLASIQPTCYLGVIASTGWDSFPRSAMEMQACGLPLVASNLQGLQESIEDGVTGYLVPPGNVQLLADCIARLADDEKKRAEMARSARVRIEREFTLAIQLRKLLEVMRLVTSQSSQAHR